MAPSTFATAAVAVVALSMCVSPASASWLNQTLLASKINATLAAKGSAGPNPIVSKVQSAITTKAAGVDQIDAYLVGNRTIYHNVKNASEAQCLINYTKGRLQYEAEIKQGAAFSTIASLPSGGAATADIVCYVDPSLGDVLNVAQGNTGTCLAGGVPVTIPTAGKYITRIEMAIDKELSFVGRFNFFVSDTLDSKPTVYMRLGGRRSHLHVPQGLRGYKVFGRLHAHQLPRPRPPPPGPGRHRQVRHQPQAGDRAGRVRRHRGLCCCGWLHHHRRHRCRRDRRR